MLIGQLPKEKLTDESGEMSYPWQRFFSKLVADINDYLSNDGYKMPVIDRPADEIKQTGVKNIGTFFYLKNAVPANDQVVVNINGTLKKITVTDL